MDRRVIFTAVILLAVITGSWLIYAKLKDTVQTTELLATPAKSPGQPASDTESPATDSEKDERIKAPDFAVMGADGNSVRLSDMLGKPVVLNFWASWCPPCKSEMPEFNKTFEEFGSEIHFMMVDAVDGSRETKENGEAYISEQGFTFPVYYDVDLEAVMGYGVRALPTSIFIDSEGYVVAGVEGAIDELTLRRGIQLIIGA